MSQPAAGPVDLVTADRQRQRTLADKYTRADTAVILYRVYSTPLTYGSTVRVVIDTVIPPGPGLNVRVVTLSVPPRIGAPSATTDPVTIRSLNASLGNGSVSASWRRSLSGVHIYINRPSHASAARARIEIESDDFFLLNGGEGPFRTWRLAVTLKVYGAGRSVVYLDHPAELSLRRRFDNSEYHSLARGVDGTHVRKTSYFESNEIVTDYVYGSHGEAAFRAIARLPFAGCIGLLAAGLTLALIRADLRDLAATVLAVVLLPPLVQVTSTRIRFYTSADIRRTSIVFWISVAASIVYVVVALLALLAIVDFAQLRLAAEIACYSAGALLGLGGILILAAVQQQILPAHYCDICGERILWRRRSMLHVPSRRTACRPCFAAL